MMLEILHWLKWRGALATGLLAVITSFARADSLTISYQDFTQPFSISTTVPPPGPNFLGQYAASLSGSYGAITYSVFAQANPPGMSLDSPLAAYLSTTGAQLVNTSTTSHHIQITFTAETFTFPATGTVQVNTQFNTNDVSGQDLSHTSQM